MPPTKKTKGGENRMERPKKHNETARKLSVAEFRAYDMKRWMYLSKSLTIRGGASLNGLNSRPPKSRNMHGEVRRADMRSVCQHWKGEESQKIFERTINIFQIPRRKVLGYRGGNKKKLRKELVKRELSLDG